MFSGSNQYISNEALSLAVNAALQLQRPLLLKGEPGTGKTMLAKEVADSLGMPFFEWHVKSTTKAQQGLYEYDAVSRLRDSQLGEQAVHDIGNYIIKGQLWQAFESEQPAVVLIDEIDKADLEFPNDLLNELDKMSFFVYETKQTIVAKHRPLFIITSNNEKELPQPFLRRCFFHYIEFPERTQLQQIVHAHHPNIEQSLLSAALDNFYQLRDITDLKKKPSTSELLDWLSLLLLQSIPADTLKQHQQQGQLPPLHGALIKHEEDLSIIQRLLQSIR